MPLGSIYVDSLRRSSRLASGAAATAQAPPMPRSTVQGNDSLASGTAAAAPAPPTPRSTVQGSVAWHEARRGRLTASRFGAAAGLSRYATPHSLWQLLTGRIAADDANDDSDNRAPQRHGQQLEPTARSVYATLMETQVVETGFWPHQSHTWLGASPDGLIGSDGLLEIKCPVHQLHTQVPDEYMAQVQGQLEVLDRTWCDFVSYWRGHMLVVRVWRCKKYWRWLFDRLERFWDAVQTDREPGIQVVTSAQHEDSGGAAAGNRPPGVRTEVKFEGMFDVNACFGNDDDDDDDDDW